MTPRNKVALLDVDDTLLDFLAPFRAWMAEYQRLPAVRDDTQTYNLGAMFGLNESQIAPLVEHFFDTEFAANLPPWPNSVAAVLRLKELGYKIVAVSSCPRGVKAVRHRRTNIESLFGKMIEEVHCLGLHSTKKAVFDQYPRGLVMEDHLGHAITAAALGHQALLFARPYNTTHKPLTRITRVSGWLEVIEIVNSMEATRNV